MKKLLFTLLFAIASLSSWAQIKSYTLEDGTQLEYTEAMGGAIITDASNIQSEITIPQTLGESAPVTRIATSVFRGTKIKKLTLPYTVKSLETFGFAGCTSLEYVYCPGVTTVFSHTFAGCTKLKTVETGALTYVGSYAFAGTQLEGNINSGNIEYIGDYAFTGTHIGGSVIIKQSSSAHNKVGIHAFEGTNISSATVSMNTIGEYAFANCNKLSSVSLSAYNFDAHSFENSAISSLSLDGSNRKIGEYAFANCKSLGEIELLLTNSSGETNVASYAFSGCTGLNRTTICYNLKIDACAFYGSTGTLYLKGTTKNMGTGKDSPFNGSNFKEVFLQENCTTVPARLLYNMPELIGVAVSKSVTSIEAPLSQDCPDFTTYYKFDTGGKYYAFYGYLTTGTTGNRELVDVPDGMSTIRINDDITSIKQEGLTNVYKATIDAREMKKIPVVDGTTWIANKLLVSPGMKQELLDYAEKNPTTSSTGQNYNMFATCDIIETAPTPLADVNCDDSVNGADVVAIYNYIVNGK